MNRIIVEDVSLVYKIGLDLSIKDMALDFIRTRKAIREVPTIEALSGVSLSLAEGERLGIIGPNGAGKSTLLKVMAGLLPPTRGRVHSEGRVSCMFELATGFEMNSSGWDNIYLRGLLLGATPAQIKDKEPEIAEFCDLGKFLDLPVRCYSSGMFARLAFAINTAFDPQILLIDEVIAAGDEKFRAKANNRLKELMDRAGMIVLVSHSLGTICDLCSRTLWLDMGKIVMDGDSDAVVAAYKEYCKTGTLPPQMDLESK